MIIKYGGLITSFAVFSTPTMRTKTTGLGSKERYCHDLSTPQMKKIKIQQLIYNGIYNESTNRVLNLAV